MSGEARPNPVLRRPHRAILADEVFEMLKNALLSHRIAPGSRLNLNDLARTLHMSNTPVRQALVRLAAEGLVTNEPYRGFAASPLLDSRAITELYGFRLLLEPQLAGRAAWRRTDESLADMIRLCDAGNLAALIDDPAHYTRLSRLDMEFHLCIAEQAGNLVVTESLAGALQQMFRYTLYHKQGAGELAWQEHRAVLAAVEAQDQSAAAEAMQAHLSNGLDRARRVFA